MSGILVVDDDQAVAAFCCQLFNEAGHQSEAAYSGEAALAALKRRQFEIVVTDVSMAGMSGIDLLKTVKAQPGSPDMILITGYGSVPDAVAAVKFGAFDYLEKPVAPQRLLEVVDTLSELRRKRRAGARDSHGIVGQSAAVSALLNWIANVATRSQPALLVGEPGTGKELAARAIHQEGPRRHLPFIAVDCGALGNAESELFGHVRGARAGVLEGAGAGTVFLDELDALPLDTQTKLFRALQERQFRSLGSNRARQLEARIVAATSVNLEQAVAEGRFRAELYYRLNVLTTELPPLRGRREDIPALVQHFLDRYGEGRVREITPEALAALQAHSWPGNVRELENQVIAMAAQCPGPALSLECVPPALKDHSRDPLQEAERAALVQTLREMRGNVGEAAAKLGISQATMYRKMAAHGLRSSEYKR